MIDERVQRQFQDGSEWCHPRYDVDPHDGLSRALRFDVQDRPAIVEALFRRLGSADLRQRTGAISLLREILPDIGADRALAALQSQPLEAGQRPAWRIGGGDLEEAAARALAKAATQDDKNTVAWLKHLAVHRSYRVCVLVDLARLDADFILKNIELVTHQMLAVITALPVDRRAEYIDALAPWPAEQPSTKAFWKGVAPAEKARLRGLIWPPNTREHEMPPARFSYQAGNQFAPDSRIGSEVLEVDQDGAFTYQRLWQNQSWTRRGRIAIERLSSLEELLARADFPNVPHHMIPPGSSLVTITSAGLSVRMDFYSGKKFAGYGEVVTTVSRWLVWLRNPTATMEAPEGLEVCD